MRATAPRRGDGTQPAPLPEMICTYDERVAAAEVQRLLREVSPASA